MKKIALTLLVMGVMVLGFGLLTASAQDANTNVTVTVTDNNLTMSPRTLPVDVPVTFNFTNNGQNAHAFVIEKEGADNEPLTFGGETASFAAIAAGATFSTNWTFEEAGEYQLAAYDSGELEAGLVVTFTVGAAQADATPTAGVTSTATVTATTAMTDTVSTPSADTSAQTAESPSNLPATGGETTNWAAMLLAFGVAALLLGGALTFARRER